MLLRCAREGYFWSFDPIAFYGFLATFALLLFSFFFSEPAREGRDVGTTLGLLCFFFSPIPIFIYYRHELSFRLLFAFCRFNSCSCVPPLQVFRSHPNNKKEKKKEKKKTYSSRMYCAFGRDEILPNGRYIEKKYLYDL
jgi:hypothetical protein